MKALIGLSALGVISLFAGAFGLRRFVHGIVGVGLIIILALTYSDWNTNISYYNNMMRFDNYAVAFSCLLIFVAFLIFNLAKDQFSHDPYNIGDYYGIMLFVLVGGILMVSFSHMVMLFIGIEILSISLYILAGSRKFELSSNEAALKYFLMGAFSTGFLLFGIVLIYGATGSFHIAEISRFIATHQNNLPFIATVGMLLIMISLAFKVSAVPFHFWAPDVYEGSPNIITTFMATVVKTAAFAAFLRLFAGAFSTSLNEWHLTLSIISIATIAVGNLTALYQVNFKRLLAYSSVAHAGYLLMSIITLKGNADNALFYYTMAYSLSSVGAFTLLIYLTRTNNIISIEGLRGFGKKQPLVAGAFTLIMLSLAGIPPTAGFFAKYFIFTTALQEGHNWIVLAGILGSLISIYYYFKVIAVIYSGEGTEEYPEATITQKAILIACAMIVLLLGIFPQRFITLF